MEGRVRVDLDSYYLKKIYSIINWSEGFRFIFSCIMLLPSEIVQIVIHK